MIKEMSAWMEFFKGAIADNSEVWHLLPIGNYTEVVLATFYYDQESIVKDVTDYYKTAYPKIKRFLTTCHLCSRRIRTRQVKVIM